MKVRIVRVLLAILIIFFSFQASAAVKLGFDLGIGWNENYNEGPGNLTTRYIYVKSIDMSGPAAAGNLKVHDQIVVVNNIVIKFIHQVEAILKAHNKNKLLRLLVRRNGVLMTLNIDPSKKNTRISKMKFNSTGDKKIDCYLMPSKKCIAEYFSVQPKPTKFQLAVYKRRPQTFINNLDTLELIINSGVAIDAKTYSNNLQDTFIKLELEFKQHLAAFDRLIHALSILKENPRQDVLDSVFKRKEFTMAWHVIGSKILVKHGFIKLVPHYLESTLTLVKEDNNKSRRTNSRRHFIENLALDFADAFVIPKYSKQLFEINHDRVNHGWTFNFMSRQINTYFYLDEREMALSYIGVVLEHADKYFTGSAEYADLVHLLRIINKPDLARQLTKHLEDWLESNDATQSNDLRAAISLKLAEVYAIQGNLQKALALVNQNFKSPVSNLKSRMAIAVAASKSLPAASWAMKSVKGLPELTDEMLKSYAVLSDEAKGKMKRSEMVSFYELMVAYKLQEFTPDKYASLVYPAMHSNYTHLAATKVIIDQLIETRRFSLLLPWLKAFSDNHKSGNQELSRETREREYEIMSLYHRVFALLGGHMSDKYIAELQQIPEYKKMYITSHLLRARLKVAYINGYKSDVEKMVKQVSIYGTDILQQIIYVPNACEPCSF